MQMNVYNDVSSFSLSVISRMFLISFALNMVYNAAYPDIRLIRKTADSPLNKCHFDANSWSPHSIQST